MSAKMLRKSARLEIVEKRALGGNRTPDTFLRTEVFYPLNYKGKCSDQIYFN